MSLGVRLRRGAWGEGSRAARALAAACLAAVAIALVLPPPAAAYPCGERRTAATQTRELMNAVSIDECRTPEQPRKTQPARTRKRGSATALTVFVLALGAALLIPIGRNGLPHGGDPFGHDPTHERPSPGSR